MSEVLSQTRDVFPPCAPRRSGLGRWAGAIPLSGAGQSTKAGQLGALLQIGDSFLSCASLPFFLCLAFSLLFSWWSLHSIIFFISHVPVPSLFSPPALHISFLFPSCCALPSAGSLPGGCQHCVLTLLQLPGWHLWREGGGWGCGRSWRASPALGTVCDTGLSAQDGSRARFQQGKDLTSSCPLSLPDTHLATAQVLKGALGAAERQAPVQPPNPPQCVWGWACASGAQTGTQAGGKQVGGWGGAYQKRLRKGLAAFIWQNERWGGAWLPSINTAR